MSTQLTVCQMLLLLNLLLMLLLQMCFCANLQTSSTPDPFKQDVKMVDQVKPKNQTVAAASKASEAAATPSASVLLSTAAESVITFISVFVVGCVITLSVYSWKKFKPDPWR